jgi:hypothetical protein
LITEAEKHKISNIPGQHRKAWADINASSWIQNHNLSVQEAQDCGCFTRHGQWHWQPFHSNFHSEKVFTFTLCGMNVNLNAMECQNSFQLTKKMQIKFYKTKHCLLHFMAVKCGLPQQRITTL